MTRDPRHTALRDAIGTFVVISVLVLLLSRADHVVHWVHEYLHLLVGALFIGAALARVERLPGGTQRYGMSLGGLLGPVSATESDVGDDDVEPQRALLSDLWITLQNALPSMLRETVAALAVCMLVFPPFVVCFYVWNRPTHGFHWVPETDMPSYVLTQLLIVGLPEEAFFRGFLQGRLHDAFEKRTNVLGVQLSIAAWLLQAGLFGVLHFIVDLAPARLAVFFPALLFGWLARWRRGIGAAIVVHALCNVLSDLLVRGWL